MNKIERFLAACRGQPVDRCPAWFMRQAGRYLPEYRALRARHSFLELCRTPELAVEVSLQPLRRFDLDGAIIFSDLLVAVEAMGLRFEVKSEEGPTVEPTVRTEADVDALRVGDPEEHLDYMLEGVRLLRRELDGKTPVLGFTGAPYTVAAYMAEGKGSRSFPAIRRMLFETPDLAARLMDKIADQVARFAVAQVKAGAQAIQLFDSWGGDLGPDDYRRLALPPLKRVVAAVGATGAPVIVYASPTAGLLPVLKDSGAHVVSVDWRVPLDQARAVLGPGVSVQGNLDPAALSLPADALQARVRDVLSRGGPGFGHVFNLGHGCLPHTPPDALALVLETVHAFRHPGWPGRA